MNVAMVPAGEYLQIRNLTEHTITDLYFTYGDYPITKVRKMNAHAKETFMIVTANLTRDYDLEFYFKGEEERKMVFKDAVKKMSKDQMWSYFFGKIVEEDGQLLLVEDPEGKEAYFSGE